MDRARSKALPGLALYSLIALAALISSALAQNNPQIHPPVISKERRPPDPAHSTRSERYLLPEYKCAVQTDPISVRVFAEYGAVLAAQGVTKPDRCIFEDDAAVSEFQKRLKTDSITIGDASIELQQAALLSLVAAQAKAAALGKSITPLDGAIAGKRTFSETVRLWNSRFLPALSYWQQRGRIDPVAADAARSAPLSEQMASVLEWECQGMFFGSGLSRSIFASVAPPGTSQHLSLLAFDVAEYSDPAIVSIMNSQGWFQTVVEDEPHFTYIGLAESELPRHGLKRVYGKSAGYWVPNVAPNIRLVEQSMRPSN